MREPEIVVRSWTTDSRRWAHYVPRQGDAVIATYPKCGTTWMQQIVSQLVFQDGAARPIQSISPWIDQRFAPIDKVMEEIGAQDHRRFLKSHLPSDALPLHEGVKYIHVSRGGLDAFMSWHNHQSGYVETALQMMDWAGMQDETIARPLPRVAKEPHAFFQTWMQEGPDARFADDMPATFYFHTARSWWADRHRPNVLLVHYNDLKADLEGEMKRIASFLSIAVEEPLWDSMLRAASFDFMRENGASLLPRAAMAWDKGHERFFNLGTNQRWRTALTSDDIARYEARAAQELSPGLARWLEHGRLATADPRELPA
ncbi:MAG: sulfotransferase domain-containing protein [Alphaproteobacteria bacterium]|nr:sulfotransferase domain-containing protein [Alphaproteobacteria bacterium]